MGLQSSKQWGEKVAAVIVLDKRHPTEELTNIRTLRRALKDRLAAHKLPVELKVVESADVPRNAMGKG